jgi:hypothetical protein
MGFVGEVFKGVKPMPAVVVAHLFWRIEAKARGEGDDEDIELGCSVDFSGDTDSLAYGEGDDLEKIVVGGRDCVMKLEQGALDER